MVAHCSNPDCRAPFRYLGRGRLFAIASGGTRHAAAVRWHWLCDDCALHCTLVRNDVGEVSVRPRGVQPAPSRPAA